MVSFKSKLDKVVGVMLMVIMAVMVMNVTWQVFSRYVIQSPSSFTDELSRYLLVWLGMLGAAYVAGQGNRLAIDILPTKLTGEAKRKLLMVINVVIILFVRRVLLFSTFKTGRTNRPASLHNIISLVLQLNIILVSMLIIPLFT